MADITTKYAGLLLRNPIIIGSCGLTASTGDIKRFESAGAAAIVFKSIFEEEMLLEALNNIDQAEKNKLIYSYFSETFDYIDQQIQKKGLEKYLRLIRDTKKEVYIPVIASVNCITPYVWTDFASKIQDAGADALELNIFLNPSEISNINEENTYLKILKEVCGKVTIPVTVKIGRYFSRPGQMIESLASEGAKGIVLFNRFYQSDIDINSENIIDGNKFSNPEEYLEPLRWIALMSGKIKADLAASTGVHNGETLIKLLLAGAKAVQVVSVMYSKGPEQIDVMLAFLEKWMEKKGYGYIDQFQGKLNSNNIKNPSAFERLQFMKYFDGVE